MFGNSSDTLMKVSRRGGFSDRNNIEPVNTIMQYKDLDYRSRMALVNIISGLHEAVFKDFYVNFEEQIFLKSVLSEVYIQQVDFSNNISYRTDKVFEIINNTILNDEYQNVLTVIEFIAQKYEDISYGKVHACECFNKIFEKEYVGYRFVDRIIVEITDETEISEIEEALKIKENKVEMHMKKALQLLSNREKPDYENSIKESISAVEAMCNHIVGRKSTLGDALKQLEKNGAYIHPSLKGAFEKLYGYTSDAAGVRHAGQIDGPDSTFDEAKFMLVACAGFINYLKGLQSIK